jgi:DNA-binding NarL/FixJ family response regulator
MSVTMESIVTRLARRSQVVTGRRLEVLRLMCQGLQSKQIARRLGVCEQTVKTDRCALLETAKVRTSCALGAWAVRSGLV